MEGMELKAIESFKILVRKSMPRVPRCLRWRVVSWSGPIALELFRLDIARDTSVVEKVIGLVLRDLR